MKGAANCAWQNVIAGRSGTGVNGRFGVRADQHERRSEEDHVQKVRGLVAERALLEITAIPDAARTRDRHQIVALARLAGVVLLAETHRKNIWNKKSSPKFPKKRKFVRSRQTYGSKSSVTKFRRANAADSHGQAPPFSRALA